MQVLVVDNYDSFTYNLVHIVEQFVNNVMVKRNDEVTDEDIANSDAIIISPGPGLPKDAGKTCHIVKSYASFKPILGVCLGMQAIGEVFGAKLKNLPQVYHGKQMPIKVLDKEEPIFSNLEEQFEVGRYHSWVIDEKTLPQCLKVTAIDENGEVMAVSHKTYNVKAVQFHPESVMTKVGAKIIENWLCCINIKV